uniref:Uncharacterized protein n=1 Tax=Glossina pallidipes TaxID=7398 RepID=A0A1B0AAM2_GLOPL
MKVELANKVIVVRVPVPVLDWLLFPDFEVQLTFHCGLKSQSRPEYKKTVESVQQQKVLNWEQVGHKRSLMYQQSKDKVPYKSSDRRSHHFLPKPGRNYQAEQALCVYFQSAGSVKHLSAINCDTNYLGNVERELASYATMLER